MNLAEEISRFIMCPKHKCFPTYFSDVNYTDGLHCASPLPKHSLRCAIVPLSSSVIGYVLFVKVPATYSHLKLKDILFIPEIDEHIHASWSPIKSCLVH